MELPDRLTTALQALNGALDLLEAAAERRVLADATRADLETELTVMQEDRGRLAEDLDQSRTRIETLSSANAEVARRLDAVTLTLQTMLADPEDDVVLDRAS